jgi:hypothetical protein
MLFILLQLYSAHDATLKQLINSILCMIITQICVYVYIYTKQTEVKLRTKYPLSYHYFFMMFSNADIGH